MSRLLKELVRVLPAAGFAVLFAAAGVGFSWMVAGILLPPSAMAVGFMRKSVPFVAFGGVSGLVGGFLFGRFLFKDRPASAQDEVEQAFIGGWGRARIETGFPMFFVALFLLVIPGYDKLAHIVGERAAAYVLLAVIMIICGISLYFYERIPKRLVLPIGFLGWILLVGLTCWYGWFGPGAFGHHH